MSRFIFCILTVLFPLQLFGQMFSSSDHYVYNTLAINAAFAGCHDALSATISSRNQWIGFEDAPKSQMLSVHTPVFNDRIGLGLLIESNSIGIFKETGFIGNYAYRMELRNGKLALGLGFGITLNNIEWNELDIADTDDPQLFNNSSTAVLPAFSFGTYYYTKKYFIGISLPLLVSYDLDQSTGSNKVGAPFSGSNYFLTGGYEMDISNKVKFLPSMLMKYHPGNPIQIDLNTQVNLNDKIGLGIGYRNNDMLVGMLHWQLNYQLKMAYSYVFETGTLGRYMNGSQEIVLNYVFKYPRKVTGPRQF
jgi:type IX secretion system PorP/SprF family membrane protein